MSPRCFLAAVQAACCDATVSSGHVQVARRIAGGDVRVSQSMDAAVGARAGVLVGVGVDGVAGVEVYDCHCLRDEVD